MTCPSCGAHAALESVEYAPAAAPGAFALELRDVGASQPRRGAEEILKRALGGGFLVVASRG